MVISETDSVSERSKIIECLNPADKSVLGRVPSLNQAQVEESILRARKTYESWQLTSLKERARLMSKLKALIASSADELALLISQEVGKPLPEAYMSELNGVLDTISWLCENAERLLGDQSITLHNPLLATKQSIIAFEPLGVVGIISPWNYPFSIPMMTACMAIMVGNTVVLKPSEKSLLTGIKIGELFLRAGFPAGCLEIVTGDRETGAYLSKGKLAKLIFTGSVAAGRAVQKNASEHLVPVTLELGGKDAAIVLPDAQVEWTARGLTWGAFTNGGQACASVERVYIIRGKRTQVQIDAIVNHTKKLKLAPASDPHCDVGPLIDQSQLDKVKEQVADALAKGAKLLTGGNERPELGGYFFEPTVLIDVNHSMKVMTEETFGPLLPIMIVNSEDEAVELTNDNAYGLAATVWASKLSNAECVARDLEVGTVLINDCLFSHACPQLPWGGIKQSGFGKTHSIFGLQDLCNIKHISIDSPSGSHRAWWYPYSKSKIRMAQGAIQLMHGRLTKKTVGLVNFVTNINKNPK
jgi:succinate-semialdehyde dehydrogenase/glutarate-semialdehyde dehydrogenase